MFVGEELSRNEGFIHAVVTFAETVLVIAPFIQWSPAFLRPCFLSFSPHSTPPKTCIFPPILHFRDLNISSPN